MRISKRQLRRIIKEELARQDLKDFAQTVAAYAFEEDVPELNMNDPSDLEWIATSDKEISRVGKKYGRTPEEIESFLALGTEERKELLK